MHYEHKLQSQTKIFAKTPTLVKIYGNSLPAPQQSLLSCFWPTPGAFLSDLFTFKMAASIGQFQNGICICSFQNGCHYYNCLKHNFFGLLVCLFSFVRPVHVQDGSLYWLIPKWHMYMFISKWLHQSPITLNIDCREEGILKKKEEIGEVFLSGFTTFN